MWGAIISGLFSMFSSAQQTNANNRARDQQIGMMVQAQNVQDAKDAEAQLRLDQMQRRAATGVQVLQEDAARDPGNLTPFQRQSLDEARRDTVRMTPKSLRGSGRTATAMIRDVEGNVRNKMVENNRDRKTSAARALSAMYPTAVTGGANLDINSGIRAGNNLINQGETMANATTANASVNANTAAALGRIFSESANDAGREGRYNDYKEQSV